MFIRRSVKVNAALGIALSFFAASLGPAFADDAELTPANVVITQGSTALTLKVTWDAPATTTNLLGYEVAIYPDGNQAGELTPTPVISQGSTGVVTFTDVDIVRGTTYQARVTAQHVAPTAGFYTERSTVGAKAFGKPNAPETVSVERTDSGTVEISWTLPTDDGGDAIAGYDVTCNSACSPSELGSQSLSTSATSLTLTNLDPTTSRTFSVTASNAKYTSTSTTSGSVIPYSPPTTPAAPFTATAGNALVDVEWGASSVTGATLTGYRVELFAASDVDFETVVAYKNLTLAQLGASREARFSSLTNGAGYVVRVAGVAGASPGVSGAVVGNFRVSGEVTPTAPYVPPVVTPTLPSAKKGAKLTARKVAILVGLTIPAKAKVYLKKGSGMSKICKVSSGKLRMLKAGKTCKVTVVIKPKKGKTKTYKNRKIRIV